MFNSVVCIFWDHLVLLVVRLRIRLICISVPYFFRQRKLTAKWKYVSDLSGY